MFLRILLLPANLTHLISLQILQNFTCPHSPTQSAVQRVAAQFLPLLRSASPLMGTAATSTGTTALTRLGRFYLQHCHSSGSSWYQSQAMLLTKVERICISVYVSHFVTWTPPAVLSVTRISKEFSQSPAAAHSSIKLRQMCVC